jgi:hypothetical protein
MGTQTLLAVCRACHRIRDERDCWLYIPGYMERHPDVEYRLMVCPDCRSRRIPPDLEELQGK